MASKKTKWAAAGLATLAAGGTAYYYIRAHRPPKPPQGIACGVHCGTERWAVKTLSDATVTQVDFTPRMTTVAQLVAEAAPAALPPDTRIAPVEMETVTVRAQLVGFKVESDHDFHIVIADLNNPSKTMIAEVPDTQCSGACASSHLAEFEAARASFIARFGDPTTQFHRVPGIVIVDVTGVAFFDFLHGQTGVAPNGIEIHPVLSIRAE